MSYEFKTDDAMSDSVAITAQEHMTAGWEVVCVYPTHVQGEGTMYLRVTRYEILLRRSTQTTKGR